MENISVDFNKPTLTGKELDYIRAAVEGAHISGDGPFTKKCNAYFEQALGVRKALLTTSCSHALEMAALLVDVKPGDEVIVPSFTFVTTVGAFALRGAKPVFIDVRADTLNMDEKMVEALITRRTKAIVPVHYAGVACEMDSILAIGKRHHIPVVEDNAQGLFGKYKGKYLGTFGALATLSFHETKNITSGEGGALLINDPGFIERAEIIREKGTNRSRFYRGQVDKYTWVDLGSSYLPSDILAAFLYAQLEVANEIQTKRQRIWEYYHRHLQAWADKNGVCLPVIPEHVEQSYHMYYILMPTLELRQNIIAHLKQQRIISVFHYVPLHTSDMGRKYGYNPGDYPVTEDISDRLLRLPFYNTLTEEDQDKVIQAIFDFHF
jgi:dTDP-4-amino-4,6-dideoxygalactose transaminase